MPSNSDNSSKPPNREQDMSVRALIIAVENYPSVVGGALAKSLPGTMQAALNFKTWLLAKWKAEGRKDADTQLVFCSEPAQPGGSGATTKDIRRALLALKDAGQSATEELYVYFSGHGFSFIPKIGSRADIVICSDFEQPALSPDCCLNLDEMISWLRVHLGPGRHYYFVDACRNDLDASQIQIASLLPYNPQAAGEASTFLLQSTVDGAVAAVGGPFPAALLAGLSGKGRAKVWNPEVPDAMFVRYDSLRSYLKSSLSNQPVTSKVEGSDGESDAVLATIRPIPSSKCTIEIDRATTPLKGEIAYTRGRGAAPERRPLDAASIVLELEPDDYFVSVQLNDGTIDPGKPVPVDLYDDRKLVFRNVTGLPAAPALKPTTMTAAVELVVPADVKVNLSNVNSGAKRLFTSSGTVSMPEGRYLATMEKDNLVLKRQEIELRSGKDVSLNLADWRNSAPRVAIAQKLPQLNGSPDFSESLGGAVADPDLNLWLALIGGGRILGPKGDYSKISQFPLHDFSAEQAGASPIYLLAGIEHPSAKVKVGLSKTADVTWTEAVSPADMPGIFEAYVAATPGSWLVSFQIADQAPYTVASVASPNRAMLITLTLDEEGRPQLSQYLLPLGHLVSNLAPEVRDLLNQRNQLSDVRFLAQASRAFRRRRDLTKQVPARNLDELLFAKWLDPIASSLAAYEALRRGRTKDIHEVVANMQRFFADIPDTLALARLIGQQTVGPAGPPLFFDGLRAFPDYAKWLPLAAGHLDFNSPWTAWRAAVNPASDQ